ncbi:SusC/RagA family TonB-linked outer membrane protein [Flavobacterium aquidurense]|jgi:TonB-linked SusC/RagA family outer membrane protein|uniref:SusC/RagA family TonB-linked outer membrane protein n=1 Tax=Flavobacterium aquidurense TaxID=362413 RepID=UPI000916B916|nr:SusC/RagA family TonB-linked outer membrane protein [Flavobacterium aquidurense]OXA69866.1 SusC/RagA family TonB-linked outer membrane protein [Flavobacterium aquidurense]SHG52893.1 TonB-linked outer membrane protein, SusC/RagA family [Flavobacterium frigidimaris]
MKQALIKRCSFLLFTLMTVMGYAQNLTTYTVVTVTGTVTDNLGGQLPGVNVTEKSTKNTVTTDFNGQYTIKVKTGATLVFSFIGMKKSELPINGRNIVNVKLAEDSNQLDNIVVVGYGTQKKRELTGAIATIKPDDLMDLPVTNLSDALKGLVPGVSVTSGSGRPGDAGSIQIRQSFGFSKDGNSTIPLIIIDDMIQVDPANGKPTLEQFNRLDPSEIESITVLKDGSAAIYGSRASQGAIVVKTKRGKAGKAKFSYNSQFAVNDAVSHSKVLNAYEFGVFSNRFNTSRVAAPAVVDPITLYSQSELEQMKGLNYNWLDEAWKPAIQQKHSFNVSGGNEDVTYFAGATYLTQGANLGYQKYDKWNFRTGINAKIAKNLDFSASVSGNVGTIDKSFTKASSNISDGSYGSAAGGEQADYGFLLHMPQHVPWETVVDGKQYYMSPFPNSNKNLGSANANTTIAGWNYFANLNNGSHQITDDNSFNINASLSYKIAAVKGLSIKGTYSRTQNSSYTEQIQLPYDLARIRDYQLLDKHLASAANPTIYNATTNPTGSYIIDTNVRNSRVYYNNSDSKSTQGDFMINYDRTFGDHQIGAMVGGEASEVYSTATRLAYEQTGKDYLGDYRTAGTLSPSNSTATKVEGGTLSYFGRINYSYKQKYLLQFLFRSDASTKFAPENYWGYFPSAQVGWIVSKESWFEKGLPWVDFLKVRYSIGKTGKDNIQPWRWMQFYDLIVDKGAQFGPGTSSGGGGTNGNGLTPRVNPNRLVTWDTSIKNNVGIDINVLKNRLNFTYDFYYDKNKEMLTDMSSAVGVPISVGGGYAEENYGQINAWGSEFSLNWSDKIKSNFSYNIGINFSYNNNEVKRFPDQGNVLPSNNATREGRSVGYNPVWGFAVWKGTSTGDGILRTDEDIANYWSYLTERATAAGGVPRYLDINSQSGMRKGSLAYQDVAGQLNPDGTVAPADGQIMKDNDYVKLANSSRTYGFTTNLGFKVEGFYFRSQISTSWGGANFVDLVNQGTSSAHNMWSRESFWNDMYAEDNPNGKYPNVAQWAYMSSPSDFWQLNTFRCFVRQLSVGYDIPKKVFADTKIAAITLGITGNNLWDLYNPYPDHYRNMYDNSSVNYPTLRTWTLNFNVSF